MTGNSAKLRTSPWTTPRPISQQHVSRSWISRATYHATLPYTQAATTTNFSPRIPGRKVVVSTDVSETSLALDGIVYVVDPENKLACFEGVGKISEEQILRSNLGSVLELMKLASRYVWFFSRLSCVCTWQQVFFFLLFFLPAIDVTYQTMIKTKGRAKVYFWLPCIIARVRADCRSWANKGLGSSAYT